MNGNRDFHSGECFGDAASLSSGSGTSSLGGGRPGGYLLEVDQRAVGRGGRYFCRYGVSASVWQLSASASRAGVRAWALFNPTVSQPRCAHEIGRASWRERRG